MLLWWIFGFNSTNLILLFVFDSSTCIEILGFAVVTKLLFIYLFLLQNEGPAVWIHAPGQDISSLQVNSLYNLAPQGQHLTFPPTQAAHGAFAGIYQPGQTVASPSTLLQQSQAVAGPVETVGPPSGSYQQPQTAQINWNSNF